MEYAGLNKTPSEIAGMEKCSQNLTSLPNSQCHSNTGCRSAENLLNSNGHKNINNDEVSESSETDVNKRKSQRLHTSVSASYLVGSPVFVCTTSTPYTSTPSFEANKSVPEYCTDTTSEQSYTGKTPELKNNSPLHKLSAPSENGDNNKDSLSSLTPSPSLNSRPKPQHVSGESSDEKGVDKRDRSKASSSREGSFDRSVSFQESNFLDLEKTNEFFRTSDSNRSLDLSRAADGSTPQSHGSSCKEKDRDRKESRESKSGEKDKKSKKAWYSVLNPTYKSRSEELKKLFKDLPSDERLIVDYSCALQKDILVHGRLYVTSNYFSFYSKIFGWETLLSIKCKDIIALTKEKTALVIPNALQINTETDKHFFTSFAARDKTYLMLFRIWQNALMDQLPLPNLSRMRRMYTSPYALQMSAPELWQWVHSSYGEELGLTSDDDDYVAPSTEDDMKVCSVVNPEVNAEDGPVKILKRNSIDSIEEDVSQGESNIEEEKPIVVESTSQDDFVFETIKFPTKSPVKSPSLPSPGVISHYSSPSGEKETPEIPTDLSDTVDSDPDKEKSIGSVVETIMCPNIASHHVGREVSNSVYGLPIDTLFTLLFTSSKFMFDLHTERKTYDVVISPWQSNPETNQKIRQVTYTLTLPTNSFGPKVSHVTETQVISAFSKPSEIYTIDAEASNSGIPYADTFFVSNHWCLTRESATETRLALWSQVKYKKNVWGFMKNVIDKNAFSGMERLMSDINSSLLLEVDKTNLKRTKRRRRRAGSKGNDVGDPLLVPCPAASINDSHKSTQIPSRKLTLPSVTTDSIGQGVVGSSIKSVTIFFLCALLVVNGFLYYRLYSLEERVVNNVPLKSIGIDSTAFKLSGQYTDDILVEEWVQILRHQESLHAEELERWRSTVIEAANHLRKAEESLRNLHSSIPSKQASKMQALLHRLQLLQQLQEQRKYQQPNTVPSPPEMRANGPNEPPLEKREL